MHVFLLTLRDIGLVALVLAVLYLGLLFITMIGDWM
jgi:hypothetical protein